MRTPTKTLIAAVSVLALLGVGVAAAQAPSTTTDPSTGSSGSADQPAHQGWLAKFRAHLRFFHKHPIQVIDKVCDGNITVDECKALLKEKVQDAKDKVQQAAQAKYEKCLESRSQDYCDGRLDQFKADHPRIYGNQTADASAA